MLLQQSVDYMTESEWLLTTVWMDGTCSKFACNQLKCDLFVWQHTSDDDDDCAKKNAKGDMKISTNLTKEPLLNDRCHRHKT